MSQTLSKSDRLKLSFKFLAIAQIENKDQLDKLIGQLEQEFPQYLDLVHRFVNLPPETVVFKLEREYPALQSMLENPGFAGKAQDVVRKIQAYLKEKGNQNVD